MAYIATYKNSLIIETNSFPKTRLIQCSWAHPGNWFSLQITKKRQNKVKISQLSAGFFHSGGTILTQSVYMLTSKHEHCGCFASSVVSEKCRNVSFIHVHAQFVYSQQLFFEFLKQLNHNYRRH